MIPGGFIKQLVRETEKESKGVKLKEKILLNEKEDVSSRWRWDRLPRTVPSGAGHRAVASVSGAGGALGV